MKKILLVIILILFVSLSACSNNIEKDIQNIPEPFVDIEDKAEIESNFSFGEVINDIKFNVNLTDYESQWLGFLEIKYPNSKIYHIKTKEINCDGCYDLSYKKDREIIKIELRNFEKKQMKIITDDIVVDIENSKVCSLFQGEWNECPKLCYTDEDACLTQCGEPICEFDYNKIIFKKLGEQCGGIDLGDCEYGLSCVYESQKDEYGICQE